MTYIKKEIPTGIIDWVNREFVFKNKIKELDDLWVDGAIYTEYSIDWNKIILSHAPQYSIVWNYFARLIISEVYTKYISKEIPNWQINWENKIFELKYNALHLDDIWLDWAIYTNYTFESNIITLNDAPKHSVLVDYFPEWSKIEVQTDVKLWDIKKEILRLLWQKETSPVFTGDVLRLNINSVSYNVWKWNVINILNNEIIRAWNLKFQNSFYSFRTKKSSSLTKELKVWEQSLEANSSNLNKKWYVLIWADIINYKWNNWNFLNWLSQIDTNHDAWEKILQLYELPIDTEKVISVKKIITTDNGINELEINYKDWWVNFNILNDFKKEKKLININWIWEWVDIRVEYVSEYPNLILDEDFCPFPKNYWLTVIAPLTAWILAYNNSLPMSESLLNIAYANLKEMYLYFNDDLRITKQKIIPSRYRFNSIR